MVTPLNEIRGELPDDGTRTRMILYLHGNDDSETLLHDLLKLPDTLLLFLSNLERLTLRFELPEQEIKSISVTTSNDPISTTHSSNSSTITRTVIAKTTTIKTRTFLIQKKDISDLPNDPARRGIHTAEIILAFPIENETPKIEDQEVFAFLPLAHFGFKVSNLV